MRPLYLPVVLGVIAASGCADDGTSSRVPGEQLEISVAPLTLPGVLNICYDIKVTTTTATVWQQDDICSVDYGNGVGGDISYVGTCDASETTNTVSIILQDIVTTAGTLDEAGDPDNPANDGDPDFVNPCPDADPCEIVAPCKENEDTFVEFNLTVMRDADQGFFDIAVNFDDIFCSAKVDCEYEGGEPIELLHIPGSVPSTRGPTMVAAFACTAGANTDTVLHFGDLRLVCDGGDQVYPIDPTAGVGNTISQQPEGYIDDGDQHIYPATYDSPLFEVGIYRDLEELGGYGKGYWNIALGLDAFAIDDLFGDCTLVGKVTATDGNLPAGMTPWHSVTPVIDINVPIPIVETSVEVDGIDVDVFSLGCGRNGLDDGGGVTTGYTDFCPEVFSHWFNPGDDQVGYHDFSEFVPFKDSYDYEQVRNVGLDGNAEISRYEPTTGERLYHAGVNTVNGGTLEINPGDGMVALVHYVARDGDNNVIYEYTGMVPRYGFEFIYPDAASIEFEAYLWEDCANPATDVDYSIEFSSPGA